MNNASDRGSLVEAPSICLLHFHNRQALLSTVAEGVKESQNLRENPSPYPLP